nr:glucoamylase family protein [Natronocella acetinitrilica]
MDDNAYDLLASESRLASFLAIAKGDVPARHWAHLGRPLTRDGPDVMLLSWSGTMFEYLMPGLLMPEPQAGLLARSAEGSIASQIRFAASRGIPWGISESGYYLFDPARNYAYRAFGAPSLALQAARGVEDLVVSPYSTFLALPWRPHAATDNLRYLETFGMLGRYGYFEALDFTPRRLDVGQSHALVRSYMAHHHGMSLVSVANALTTQNAITRFSAEPRYGACKLLLQERMPPDPELEYPASPSATPRQVALDTVPALDPWNVPVDTPTPRVHLLSNGRYGVLATNGGGGGSFWNNIALTRWSADSTSDDRGCWVYLEDVDAGDTWSIARQPSSIREGDEQVRFHAHAVEYLRHSRGLVQTLEVTVCPRDDVELRRITLTNHGEQVRRLVLTTYAELVLGDAAADRQHPRFSGLFVQCSYDAEQSLLLFERRSREGSADAGPLLGEFLVGVRGVIKPDGVETDRGAFLERDGSLAKPPKAGHDQGIGAAVGSGLDPIASLRKTLTLEPGATVRLALVRIVAPTREALMQTRQRFAYWANVQYAFDEARTRIARDLHGGGIGPGVLHDLVRLTSALLCPHPDLRAPTAILARNQLGQAGLWGMGISGDHPVVLLKVPQSAGMDVVNLLLKAHEFWRKRNLPIDVVFLATGDDGYSGNTRDALHRAISLRHAEAWIGRRGGLFVLTSASQGEADVVLLHAAASLVLDGGITHPLAALDRLNNADIPLPLLPARPGTDFPPTVDVAPSLPADLKFWNGLGGFTSDGREYVMLIEGVNRPPAAWINVIANPQFGCTVSESGGGYTWWLNSGENRLTPWRNDPVLDMPGECIYLRDEETGDLWCPTPAPMYESGAYLARHGAGYSRFEHCRLGVDSELSLFVDIDQPVKVARLRVSNRSERARRLTVTFYAEWVLGTRRETGAGYLIPAWNAEHRALLVRNPYGAQCPGQTVFLATTQEVHGYTADRSEFLGRDGGLHAPAGLARVGLSGRVDAGRDTCAALQVHVDLPVGGTEEVVFLLGAGANEEAALTLIRGCRDTGAIQRMRDAVDTHWRQRLGTVTLESPDAATDILFNGWLLYQTLASRLHGRTGLYQSSGAFGFRDQLQDTTALLAAAPSLCRAQIVAAAARQFPEGDVLHWWHPPAARGVRTRISDDLLWLPWVVCEYIAATDEVDVLDESITWLSGDPLGAEEGDRYSEYAQSGESASLYEHCLRAIRRVDHAGAHGLPLMGGGDWNDGFNRVGDKGRGESVWLGWFLLDTLRRFAPVCETRGDLATAQLLTERAATLAQALRDHAWDGGWYRRAYHDDGSALGTADAEACEIDAIAQSWAVLSGGDGSGREHEAMAAVGERLMRAEDGLVLLFEPPFKAGAKDVGYIGAYPPGVRENGGQYTHAAAWTGLAFARLGNAERTAEVLRILNPINHALTAEAVRHYRVEPYVLAADVYGYPPHVGRGGWTWYTGSAAWYYRFILEGVLGITRRGDTLMIKPCLPPHWPGATVTWRHRGSVYHIQLVRTASAPPNTLSAPCTLPMLDDGAEHRVAVYIV